MTTYEIVKAELKKAEARLAALEAFAEAVRGSVENCRQMAHDGADARKRFNHLYGAVILALAKLDGKE